MEITRENLEAVVNQFASTIIQRKGYDIKPHEYLIVLSDQISNDIVVQAGNPVKIIIKFSIFADAIMRKNFIEFKQQLDSSLRVVPKMLRTLTVVPVSDYLKRDMDMRRWLKSNKIQALPPRLPKEEIKFVTQLSVTAVHKPSGLKITLTGNTNSEWKLQEQAEEALCRLVQDAKEEQDDE